MQLQILYFYIFSIAKNAIKRYNKNMTDEYFMKKAAELSSRAIDNGNEPFGAVLVKDGKIVYTSENRIFTNHDFTYHAEMGLIRDFCKETGITDLREYTIYSSCEPCFMCSGALVWAKIGRLVYGASNKDLNAILGKTGTDCSKIVFENSDHKPQVTAGIYKEQCIEILRKYFERQ